jgi:type VI secretion system protein ImpI/type VI secretion system protein
MLLQLSILNSPDGAKPEIREIGNETAIGRGDESDWILADSAKRLSRRHCLLTPYGAAWRVVDLSLNGTFINDSPTPLGRDRSHELRDGDRIRIGAYVIEARHRVMATPFAAAQNAPASAFPSALPPQDRFNGAGSPGSAEAFPTPWHPDEPATVPERFPGDPDALETLRERLSDDLYWTAGADRSPAISDAWRPPPPGRVVLPEDWDLEEIGVEAPPPAAAAPTPAAAKPALTPDSPIGEDWDPTDPAMIEPVPAASSAAAVPVSAPLAEDRPPRRDATADDGVLIAAFLRGTGLHDLGEADPVAMMESVGKLLRVMVEGLREVQASRSTIKREFRILTTIVSPADSNPIKFSASNEAALRSLLIGKRAPESAVGEVLDGIRLHELAMIAAMRDAVQGLLGELDPAKLSGKDSGLSGVLAVPRKARAFDQFEALYGRIVQALADDFDSVFGKAFARAYERVAFGE